jgi:hypothetical protein
MSHVTTRKPFVINASAVLVESDIVRKADRTMDEQHLIAMLKDLAALHYDHLTRGEV